MSLTDLMHMRRKVTALEAENARLRAVVEAACQYVGALDSGGLIEINDTHDHLVAAVRSYEAQKEGET